MSRPAKELRGFERISLKPGEKRNLNFTVPGSKLGFFDETTHTFVTQPGARSVLVGASSADIRLSGQFELVPAAADKPPHPLSGAE